MLSMEEIRKIIREEIAPLKSRVHAMQTLGKLLVLSEGKTLSAQVKTANNEVVDNAKFIQPFGLDTKPPIGSEALLSKLQGNPNNVVVLVIGNRELRFEVQNEGEVALYDNSGNYIYLKNGGDMDVFAPNTLTATANIADINAKTVNITAETVNVNGGKVNLAGGGQGVARLGDMVEVDPNTHKGTITSASTKVTAA